MPDYNLGRAHGEIIITADTRGADEAQRSLHDTTIETDKLHKSTEELSRIENERNRRASEAVAAANRRKQAEADYKRVMADTTATAEKQMSVEAERNKARGEHLQATRRLSEAERALSAEISGNTDVVNKFTRSLNTSSDSVDKATRRMRDFRREINDVSRDMNRVSGVMTSFLGSLAKAAAITGGVGIAGGAIGLLGAGGIEGVVSATAAVAELSGALLLIPAAVGGAVTSFAALAIATQGVGDAFKNWDDPAKFAESLQKLSPAAQQVMTTLASFKDAFRSVQLTIQEGLFAPLVNDIQPLVFNLLPLFMNGLREVANAFGQIGHEFAVWLQMPGTMQLIGNFIHNVAEGLRSLLPAMQPFLNAFLTLSQIGSTFFTQIGEAITRVATAFNDWVQTAAANGDLQRWIQSGIDAFGQLFNIIKELGIGLGNIFSISGQYGGFLDFIQKIAQEFRAWTESVEGKQALQDFFASLHEASVALSPILGQLAGGLGTIIQTILDLGIAIAPGLLDFFTSFAKALEILGPSLVASAPALNQFLTALGDTLVKVIEQLGPELPGLLQNFADVATDLAPMLTTLAEAFAKFLGQLTPEQLEIILGLVVAFTALSSIITTLTPIITAVVAVVGLIGGTATLVVVAIVALVAAIVWLILNFDEVKKAAGFVWDKLKEFASWIGGIFSRAWKGLVDVIKSVWKDITDTISGAIENIGTFFKELPGKAFQWGKDLIQSFIDGIKDKYQALVDSVKDIADVLPDWLKPGSPTKKGPLSQTTTEQMGADHATGFATGIAGGATDVEGAAGSVAGGAATGFSTAGLQGRSGQRAPKSGFEQWVEGLTTELSDWSSLVHNAFDLFKDVFDIALQTTKIVASLWNKGDNPLTQPGGFFGPPKGPEQQQVPGVPPPPPVPGKAPLPELVPKEAPPPQQGVPGVTPGVPREAPAAGQPGGVGRTLFPEAPTPAAPAPTPPPAAPTKPPAPGAPAGPTGPTGQVRTISGPGQRTVPLIQNPDGTWTSPNPAWAALIKRESAGQAVITQGIEDQNKGPNRAQGLFQITPDTWRRHGGTAFANTPNEATPEEQAVIAARIITTNPSGSDWGANLPGRENAAELLKGVITTGEQPAAPPGAPQPYRPGGPRYGQPQVAPRVFETPLAPPPLAPPPPPAPGGTPGPATATGPRGIPAGQVKGITPITEAWATALGAQFGGQLPSTYGGHQVIGGVNYGIDWGPFKGWTNRPGTAYGGPTGAQIGTEAGGSRQVTREEADKQQAFAMWVGTQPGVEQVIYMNPYTGFKVGYANGKPVGPDMPGTTDPGYYRDDWTGHSQHVHTRMRQGLNLPQGAGIPPVKPSGVYKPGGPGYAPPGAPPPQAPAPQPTGPSIFGPGGTGPPVQPTPPQPSPSQYPPGTVAITEGGTPIVGMPPGGFPPGFKGTILPAPTTGQETTIFGPGAEGAPVQQKLPPPGTPIIGPAAQGPVPPTQVPPGQPSIGNALPQAPEITPIEPTAPGGGGGKSPADMLSGIASGAANIAGQAFQVFDDVIANITAFADMTAQLVRGFENTEDINRFIDNVQTFLKTAADIATLTSTVLSTIASAIPSAGGADFGGTEGAKAGLSAAAAIAGVVSSAISAVDKGIDLTQQAYKMITKYGAIFAGYMLGGPETGALGGNVRMLLNTRTGELYSYSQDNPENKSVKNLPQWMSRAYGGPRPGTTTPVQMNIYAGPGADPKNLISDTMWLVNSGAPQTASVSGVD